MRGGSNAALAQRSQGRSYASVRVRGGRLTINEASRKLLKKVDAVAFDCDGVLIDARMSYDATIMAVVRMMVKELTGVSLPIAKVAPKLIGVIRRTGGFNSDWDTTYALTLISVVALEKGRRSLGRRRDPLDAVRAIVDEFGSAPRETGRVALDAFLDARFPSFRVRLDMAREHLGYPSRATESKLAKTFDEMYFGGALYEKLHGEPAKNPRRKGLIELERVLVKRKTLESIAKIVGPARLVMITGRPYIGTEHSLGKALMSYFHRGSSMFIGDADIFPELREEYDRYRKPSPEALLRASERLSSSMLLYVGDSGEDVMMVQHAKEKGLKNYLFAGVYETSPDPEEQVSFFEREGADVIAEGVNLVPSALLLPSRKEGGGRS
jgi:phosphoglycolate phosphatase-like HAD superfamily hydrolase